MDAEIHPEVLEETPPQFLSSLFYSSVAFIEEYGWYLLGAGLLLYYLRLRIEPYILRFKEQQEERKFTELCKKNPDLIRSRQEAMEAARQRMQEKFVEDARAYAEKLKEREAKKREELLARKEGINRTTPGHRLGDSTAESTSEGQVSKKKSNHKPDYNPLMGSGSSGGYRPSRRSCPGGGCG